MPTSSTPLLSWMTALADATRARLLRALERQELTVVELCGIVQLPQSTVSRHLKVLADEGWVASRREGTSRLYRVTTDSRNGAAKRLWLLVREQFEGTPAVAQDEKRLASVLGGRRTRSQEFFSSAAGKWDKLRSEHFGERFDLLGLLGLLDESWTVGDLGCGTAQLTQVFAPFVKRVIAVDDSPVMLRHAKQRLRGITNARLPKVASNVELRRGELTALPIDDRRLDAAVLCMVLHHVADPPAVLREAARVLRAGGKLLIIDILHHDREEYRQQMGHVWLGFEPAQIERWLNEAGLKKVRIRSIPVDPQAKGPALFTAIATQ